jgi:hypothetical protein
MIRITKSHSAIEAEKYFDLALKTSDYYAKEQGTWGGKGVERLGLKGKVERKDFVSLAGNKVPGTGKRLTLRQNTTREEKLRDKETGIPILVTETGQPITSPGLNPIERVWKLTRQLCLHNVYFAKLDQVWATLLSNS